MPDGRTRAEWAARERRRPAARGRTGCAGNSARLDRVSGASPTPWYACAGLSRLVRSGCATCSRPRKPLARDDSRRRARLCGAAARNRHGRARKCGGLPEGRGGEVGAGPGGRQERLSATRDWRSQLAAFANKFEGTETAVLSAVDLITESIGPSASDALDGFIAANPGTTAAAKALHTKGFHLAKNSSLGERPGHDPTDRFFRVADIARELRSGRYPQSEWVEKARSW